MFEQYESRALRTILDTESVEEKDRLSLWHDVAAKVYVEHSPIILDADGFSARTLFGTSWGYDISLAILQGITLERTQYHTRTDESGRCFLCMLLNGSIKFIQDDIEIIPKPNQIFMIDTSRPYKIIYLAPSNLLHFMVPRDELERQIGNIRRYAGVMTSPENPTGDIASTMMKKMAFSLEFTEDRTEYYMLHAAFELAMTALAHEAEISGARLSSCREVVLARLDHAISQQLHDPNLNTAMLAEKAGVSIRYANKLLAENGTSLMRYVKNIRLESCARALRDPAQQSRSITDIALSFGFNEMSHFSRVFREQFDVSPRDYRKLNNGEG